LANLRRARYLLTATTIPLNEIARQCGFDDYSYFSNRFMTIYGERPSTARKQNGLSENNDNVHPALSSEPD